MKNRFFKSLAATVVGLLIAVSASAITCSSGNYGRCFTYTESDTIIPYDTCKWTGMEKDTCRGIGIVVRMIARYVL